MKILNFTKARLSKLVSQLEGKIKSLQTDNAKLRKDKDKVQEEVDDYFYCYLAALDEVEILANEVYKIDPKNRMVNMNFPKKNGALKYTDRILAKMKKFQKAHKGEKK